MRIDCAVWVVCVSVVMIITSADDTKVSKTMKSVVAGSGSRMFRANVGADVCYSTWTWQCVCPDFCVNPRDLCLCCAYPDCTICNGRYCQQPGWVCCTEPYTGTCPSDTTCCGGDSCCQDDTQCVDDVCCEDENVCGESCCNEEGSKCCKNQDKGEHCCKSEETCCGEKCCEEGYQCCDGDKEDDEKFCCKKDEPCCGDKKCCEENQRCCHIPTEEGEKTVKTCCAKYTPLADMGVTDIEGIKDEYVSAIAAPTGQLNIYALPMGQGDCTVIQCPNGNIILVDMGSSGLGWNAGAIKAWLGAEIANIRTIILTHADLDHINYIPQVLEPSIVAPNLQRIILGGNKNLYTPVLGTWLGAVKAAKHGTDVTTLVSGGTPCMYPLCRVNNQGPVLNYCDDPIISFKILAANVGTSKNQQSIVVKVAFNQHSVLLPGDIEGSAQTLLLGNPATLAELPSTYYKIAHHGAETTANQLTFLEAIRPKGAFVSSPHPNQGRFGHPRCRVIEDLYEKVKSLSTAPTKRFDCGGSTDTWHHIVNFCYCMFTTSPETGVNHLIQLQLSSPQAGKCAISTKLVSSEQMRTFEDVPTIKNVEAENTWFNVSWTSYQPTSSSAQYYVEHRHIGSETWTRIDSDAEDMWLMVTDLSPGVTEIRVTAVRDGEHHTSHPVTVTIGIRDEL